MASKNKISKSNSTSKKAPEKKPAIKNTAGKTLAKKVIKKDSPAKVKAEKSFKLKQILDITQVEKFKNEVLEYINANDGDVNFDASDVKRITTPCIQILFAVQKQLQLEGRKFSISSVSDVFSSAIKDLGLISQFPKWS